MSYTDDYAGDIGTTGRLTTTAPVNGVINFVGDQDWFRIYLTTDTTYAFNQVQTPQTQIYNLDSYLRLLDASGQQIKADDDSGFNRNASITYTPTASGYYYLSAEGNSWSYFGTLTGSYQLTATAINHAPVVTPKSISVGIGQLSALSSLFSVIDPDVNSITSYTIYDPVGVGYFSWPSGLGIVLDSTKTTFTVPAFALSSVTYHGDSVGAEMIGVAASDGSLWSYWGYASVTVTGSSLSIAALSAEKMEGNSGTTPFTFTVTRTGDISGSATANWAITGGAASTQDFFGGIYPSGTLSLNPGDATKTITVLVTGDSVVEPNENFIVTLSNPSGATLGTSSATGIIYNDDVTLKAEQIFRAKGIGDGVEKAGVIRVMADFAKAAYDLQSWEHPASSNGSVQTTSPIDDYSPNATTAKEQVFNEGWAALALNLPPLTGSSGVPGWIDTNRMSDGFYTNGNAAAFVARSADAVVIAFRGTNDNGDPSTTPPGTNPLDPTNTTHPDKDQWTNMSKHYALFAPLIDALDKYISNSANGINHVYVTGHSMGGAMAIQYMSQHPGSMYEAVTFAAPAFTGSYLDRTEYAVDIRETEIEIAYDPVPMTWDDLGVSPLMDISRPGHVIRFAGDQTMSHSDWIPTLALYGFGAGYFANNNNHNMDYYRTIAQQVDGASWATVLTQSGDQNVYLGAEYHVDNSVPGDLKFTVAAGNDSLAGGNYQVYYGGGGNDTLTGGSKSELFIGAAGNDTIDGGGGINTACYSGNISNYTVAKGTGDYTIKDDSGTDGTDILTNIQRLRFSDTSVALDMNGNAGTTVRILGAVFGAASVANKTFVGIGLSLLDSGMSYADLMQMALTAAGATTHATEVNLLWKNLFGSAPTTAQAQPYVDMLDHGDMSVGALGVVAASLDLNANNINLVGLQSTGIEYS